MSISYKVIKKSSLPDFETSLISFYNRYFPEKSNELVVKNSSVCFVALKKNEIVGVCRIITDYSRYALLLDLIVRKKERERNRQTFNQTSVSLLPKKEDKKVNPDDRS